jgi:hypothetical protein
MNVTKLEAQDWIAFQPSPASNINDRASVIDLRFLNEAYAGERGRILARKGQFVHESDGTPVRFWAVNGPPQDLRGEDLKNCARMLARYGVNMVRIHHAIFDERGELDLEKVKHVQDVVAAMKGEGIYSHISFYFPLWFTPPSDLPWMSGYDGKQHPFATLMFHPGFQEKYRDWIRGLLTTPDPQGGDRLVDDSAVFGIEMQNEDSFFFWTFSDKNIPDPLLQSLERQFGEWAGKKYGSLQKGLQAWQNASHPRDNPKEGRLGFRPLWNIANERTPRDVDTAKFLYETQTKFYRDTYEYVRSLGFRGLIHTSNWTTASPERLGPIEKLSYTVGDFIDRHGYFECHHQGENSAWSIRDGHSYWDRSALRMNGSEPGKPKDFNHPAMDLHYDDKPSMISETTFTRPNRFRSEAPLFFACYGALQDSDAIVHFALDGVKWQVKPNYFMQQWTLASPAMMGQFPAAALIYRQGLVQSGPVVGDIQLNREELLNLKGTPFPQNASLDELRAKDLPQRGMASNAASRIDPLLHFVGQTKTLFTDGPGRVDAQVRDDRKSRIVESATQELLLNFEAGTLTLRSPRAQGISGALSTMGAVELPDIQVASDMELGHIVVVSLDGNPLSQSKRMLVQVMSEEMATDFRTKQLGNGKKQIESIGRDPWLFRQLSGTIEFHKPMRISALDVDGRPSGTGQVSKRLELQPDVIYYQLTPLD